MKIARKQQSLPLSWSDNVQTVNITNLSFIHHLFLVGGEGRWLRPV